MKILYILVTLLITGTLNAQIKTGGGGFAELDATVVDLSSKLKENDYKCSTQGPTRLSKDKNLIESYWKLSLLKNLDPKSEGCEEATAYLNCVNDKYVRKIARKLKGLAKDNDRIATTYKIPQSDVDKMIIFFTTQGEIPGEEKLNAGDDL